MNLNLLFATLLLFLFIGSKATISRSPHHEMKKLKEVEKIESSNSLDEFWPFPKTISESDPYVFELEKKLLDSNLGS